MLLLMFCWNNQCDVRSSCLSARNVKGLYVIETVSKAEDDECKRSVFSHRNPAIMRKISVKSKRNLSALKEMIMMDTNKGRCSFLINYRMKCPST